MYESSDCTCLVQRKSVDLMFSQAAVAVLVVVGVVMSVLLMVLVALVAVVVTEHN